VSDILGNDMQERLRRIRSGCCVCAGRCRAA
jgi:hypothetical protein